MSYVRGLFLRSTFAATAPRSAVAELGVVRRSRVAPMNESRSKTTASSTVARVSHGQERVSGGLGRCVPLPGACQLIPGPCVSRLGRCQRHLGSVRPLPCGVSAQPSGGACSPLARVSRPLARVSRALGACALPLGSVRVEPWAVSAERCPVSFYSIGVRPSPSRLLFHVSPESNRTPNHALQRTAPRVTVAAILRPRAFTSSHLSVACMLSFVPDRKSVV